MHALSMCEIALDLAGQERRGYNRSQLGESDERICFSGSYVPPKLGRGQPSKEYVASGARLMDRGGLFQLGEGCAALAAVIDGHAARW